MAYENKKDDGLLKKLKDDIKAGSLEKLYVFHGEESYLKEYYRNAIEALISKSGFSDFNVTYIDSSDVTEDSLTDAVESLPFASDKKLVVIRDLDLSSRSAKLKEGLPKVFENLPDYLCLILYYDAIQYKPDKRLNIYKSLEKNASVIEFQRAKGAELVNWLKRRFSANGKKIDTSECDYIIFICGSLMTNLITEVDKISAYTKADTVKRSDIDAVASRVLDADVFDLTDCVVTGDYQRAIGIFRDLMESKNEPIAVLALLIKQVQRVYAATLALSEGKGERYIMELYNFRSTYPARRLIEEAKRTNPYRSAKALDICCNADIELKSNIPDSERVLELAILRMSQV
ncbi:MAG: DNA polymerase III subunit delta [Clostridiaceae bacterium]|nr:DNA polymerase III subunit delta [Clostridiaceae bacterium]